MRKTTLAICLILVAAACTMAEDSKPFHIMVVDDDGIDAPGLLALVEVLQADPAYRVTVVAPTEQQSAKGSGLTIHEPVLLRPHEPIAGAPAWSVDATPATSARVGLSYVLADDPPDLVVSGINKGENVGRIAWYSGTVGAARESVLAGVTAVSFSLQLNWADPRPDFEDAARWAKPVIDALRHQPLPTGVYLNVNIPKDPERIIGYRLCRQGLERPQVSTYELVRRAEAGVSVLRPRWAPAFSTDAGSDTAALHEGWVTLTPLSLDSTAYRSLPNLQALMELEPPAALPEAVE